MDRRAWQPRRARAATVRAHRASAATPPELLEPRRLLAGWSPVGPETPVNDSTVGAQQTSFEGHKQVASDGNGNYVVVWSGQGTGDADGIYARRFNASGPLGPSFRVNTFVAGAQVEPAVAMDGLGGFVVVWSSNGQDGNGWGVYGQRYSAAGVAQGAEFPVNATTAGHQFQPSIAADADGDFIVTWTSENIDGTGLGIAARRYNAAGTSLGAGEFTVNGYTDGDQRYGRVAVNDAGAFTVVWQSDYVATSSIGIFMQRYNASGGAVGGWSVVNTTTTGYQLGPSIGMNGAGAYVVAWTSDVQDGGTSGVYAQRFTAAGAPTGGEFQANTTIAGSQQYPSVAVEDDGSFVIAWASDGSQDGNGWGAYSRQFNSTGVAIGGEVPLNTTTAGNQQDVGLAMVGGRDFVAVWSGTGIGDGLGVFLQRFEDLSPGVVVSPTSGLVTTDAGTTANFTVVLASMPTVNVTISIASSDTTEGTVSASSLTFTPANWDVPQTVTVTGVDDGGADGNVAYTIVTGAASSADADYNGMAVADVSAVNNTTLAAGGLHAVYFDNADFTGPRVSRIDSTVNFNWAAGSPDASIGPDTFSARWVGELLPQYSQTYTFYTTSDDGVRLWVNGVPLIDNWTVHAATTDTATIALTAGQWTSVVMELYENTGVAVARLEWSSPSRARQVVPSNRLRPTNATPVAADESYSLPANGSLNVGAAGVLANDVDGDGDGVTASLISGPARGTLILNANGSFTYTPAAGFFGTDSFVYAAADVFGGSDPATVTLTVTPPPGITVTPTSGLTTTEAGGASSFSVVLNTMPAAPVRIDLSSSDPDEGTVSATSLFFDSTNWNVPQTVTVTGVNDAVVDGNQAYTIVLASAVSADPSYAGIDPADVAVTNADTTVPPPGDPPPAARPPVAGADTFTGTTGKEIRVVSPGVLANDAGAAGLALTAALVQPPSHGTVSLSPDGSFVYAPADGFSGTDTFTYAVTDAAGKSDTGTVIVRIDSEPTEPVVVPPPVTNLPPPAGGDDAELPEEEGQEDPIIVIPPVPVRPPARSSVQVQPPESAPDTAKGPRGQVGSVRRTPGDAQNAPPPIIRSSPRNDEDRNGDDEAAERSDDGGGPLSNGNSDGRPTATGPQTATPSTALPTAAPLLARMDAMAKQMGSAGAEQNATIRTVSQVAMAMTAGYVVWSLRGASLLASLLTSIPLWRSLDPLPILETRADKVQVKKARQRNKRKKDDQQDKIGTMVS